MSNFIGALLLASITEVETPRLKGMMLRRRAERHMRRGKADMLGELEDAEFDSGLEAEGAAESVWWFKRKMV